jgi:general stress protein YciG
VGQQEAIITFSSRRKDLIMSEKSRRGFAAMDENKRRAIARMGGRAAHAKGTAHRFTPEEARAAGRKGGHAAHTRGTARQFTPEDARQARETSNQPSELASEIIGMPGPMSGKTSESALAPNLVP